MFSTKKSIAHPDFLLSNCLRKSFAAHAGLVLTRQTQKTPPSVHFAPVTLGRKNYLLISLKLKDKSGNDWKTKDEVKNKT